MVSLNSITVDKLRAITNWISYCHRATQWVCGCCAIACNVQAQQGNIIKVSIF